MNGPKSILGCASRSREACCCSVHESPPQQATSYSACSNAHLTGAVWFSFAYAKTMTFIASSLSRIAGIAKFVIAIIENPTAKELYRPYGLLHRQFATQQGPPPTGSGPAVV